MEYEGEKSPLNCHLPNIKYQLDVTTNLLAYI